MRLLARPALVLSIFVLAHPVRAIAQVPGSPGTVPAVDSVKLQLIRSVLTESHAVDLMLNSMEAAAPAQRSANPAIPAIPAAFWDRFLAAARDRRGELGALFIQVYDRHFTADDLRQLLAFYRTPIGQKLLAEQPAITQEAMASGQQWGQRLGFEIGQKMMAEGQKAP